jgi:hypothetical protein
MIAVYRQSASGKLTYLGCVDDEDAAEAFFEDHVTEAAEHDQPGGTLVTKPATAEQVAQQNSY